MTTGPGNQARGPPQLPHGTSTTLSGFSETFSFHSSPESFISSRVLALQAEDPKAFDTRAPVRAKILNRNVAVISSHTQICHVLSSTDNVDATDPAFVAAEAYMPLMAQFFPSPNVLLTDGLAHYAMRKHWEDRMQAIKSETREVVSREATRVFEGAIGSTFDLYELLKKLVWKILLGLFLRLDESDADFGEIQRLQEDLLRGQFSLFPVSINVKWWQSPRSRGIAAKDKLQRLILQRLERDRNACPFRARVGELDEIANHVLLFTSSLAVKAIASLLTPYLMNLFLFQRAGVSPAEEISGLGEPDGTNLLRSLMFETERLSPPIVGIMRKVTRDTIIPSASPDGPDVLLPKGWDAWLYFVGGGRDPAVYGFNWAQFRPDRFLRAVQDAPHGFAFSVGDKACLGEDLVRDICVQTGQLMLQNGLRVVGDSPPKGVRAWLGWDENDKADAVDWTRDMKQLPTQRPAKPVLVRLLRRASA